MFFYTLYHVHDGVGRPIQCTPISDLVGRGQWLMIGQLARARLTTPSSREASSMCFYPIENIAPMMLVSAQAGISNDI